MTFIAAVMRLNMAIIFTRRFNSVVTGGTGTGYGHMIHARAEPGNFGVAVITLFTAFDVIRCFFGGCG